ncbi:MAG: signal peptidase I [Coriobacteriales bacterium]|nr:signal peptidase I [Coriobacteriales bacterium]
MPPPPSTGLPALRPLPEAGSLPSSEALQSSPSSPEERPRKSGILRLVLEFAIVLCIAFGVTWLVRTFVIQIFEVPSASMEPTIMTGDKFAADMLFFKIDGVKPGEIVCFNDKIQPGRILVKRVIAVGGQTVDLQNGRVVVDGVTLFEPYTQHKLTEPLPSQYQDMTITYPYTVPEGSIWVMGDNRTSSADSRYFGVIQESEVLGHALFVFWPFEDIGMLQ